MTNPASTITDETVKRAADAWGLAILNGGGEATVLGVMRTALEAVWPEPEIQLVTPFTPEEIEAALHVAGQSHGSWTSCPRNTRAMCRHFGAYESFSKKLEALANGS